MQHAVCAACNTGILRFVRSWFCHEIDIRGTYPQGVKNLPVQELPVSSSEEEMIRRIRSDMLDSYDEELEMEVDVKIVVLV